MDKTGKLTAYIDSSLAAAIGCSLNPQVLTPSLRLKCHARTRHRHVKWAGFQVVPIRVSRTGLPEEDEGFELDGGRIPIVNPPGVIFLTVGSDRFFCMIQGNAVTAAAVSLTNVFWEAIGVPVVPEQVTEIHRFALWLIPSPDLFDQFCCNGLMLKPHYKQRRTERSAAGKIAGGNNKL